ncbi:MAG: hypothetical protein LBI87_01375, partial [Candidatus Accumulibacter sp.]|nr:hypothetical protein [Accumulibacter sp.]
EVKGIAGIESALFDGWIFSANAENQRKLEHDAMLNALENYVAERGSAMQKLYERHREEIIADLGRYVINSVKIRDWEDKDRHTRGIEIRATIDVAALQARLDSNAAISSISEEEKSPLVVVFMTREQESVQEFDDRRLRRGRRSIQQGGEYREETEEGESIRRGSVKTHGYGRAEAGVSVTAAVETGGSRVRRNGSVTWKVETRSDELNSVMNDIFSDAGYAVYEADEIPGLPLEKIRKEFRTANELSPGIRQAMTASVRQNDVFYLVYGTLDVGARERDPASGLVRAYASVQGKVLDLRGKLPRTVASALMGPYAGLGPTEDVARLNALKEAAARAAQEISNKLNLKAVR